jgi:hypothetical protein
LDWDDVDDGAVFWFATKGFLAPGCVVKVFRLRARPPFFSTLQSVSVARARKPDILHLRSNLFYTGKYRMPISERSVQSKSRKEEKRCISAEP